MINKDQLKLQKLKQAKLLVFAAPTALFKPEDINVINQYVDQGGNVLVLAQDGGDKNSRCNLNAVLARYGITLANNSVIRTSYFKYFHPKEVLVTNGMLHEDFLRMTDDVDSDTHTMTHVSTQVNDDKEPHENRTYPGLKFVYPFGTALTLRSPAVPLLTTGSVSFPVNAHVFAQSSLGAGSVFVLGSYHVLSDAYFDAEENAKIVTFILNQIKKSKTRRAFQPEKDVSLEAGNNADPAPNIEALSEKLKHCIHETPDISHNFLSQFKHKLFEADFRHLPEAVNMYKQLSIPYAPLKTIDPVFETPMLGLTPSVFPPILVELETPRLELFDLDDEFANQEWINQSQTVSPNKQKHQR